MTTSAIRLSGVTKRYGSRLALDNLSLEIPKGSICGLIGPNGAGKTTCFGVIGGLLRADQGEIDILGIGPFEAKTHAGRIGMLPQDAELSPYTPVRTLLTYFAELQGMSRVDAGKAADAVLDAVMLQDVADQRVRQLSHGMRRRVAVAQAMLGEPEVLLLDEPLGGLDPRLVAHMRDLLKDLGRRCTLVVSSHILSELESLCDHVIFLEKGRVTHQGAMSTVTERGSRTRIFFEGAPPSVADLAPRWPDLRFELGENHLLVEMPPSWDPPRTHAAVLPVLFEQGVRVAEIRCGERLEDAYRKLL